MKEYIQNNLAKVVLASTIVFSFFIQFYKLDNAPVGGLVDEPAFGFSAYSILTDAHDERGKYLPLIFESYGDQKLPLYVYVLTPIIKIFGLTNFAARLPAALSAILLTPIIYLLLRQFNITKHAAIITTSIFACSPFIFMMGRIGRESTLGLLFYILGVLIYLRFLNNQHKVRSLILAMICLALSWYSYVAYRFVLVFTLPALIVIPILFQKISLQKLKVSFIVILLLIIPSMLVGSIFTARLSQVGIFNDKGGESEIFEKRSYCNFNNGGILCRVSANKGVIYGRKIVQGMVEAFSPQYLFLKGDAIQVQNVDNYGQYYLFTLPFFYIGLYAFVKNKNLYDQTTWHILLLILPLSVFPAVIADLGQKMRSAPFILLTIIPIGIGLDYLLQIAKNYFRKNGTPILATSIAVILLVSTVIFQTNFHTVHIAKYSTLYNSHIIPLLRYLKQFEGKQPMYISPFFDDPIMYYAFYNRLNPKQYRDHVQYNPKDSGGFTHALSYKNIYAIDVRSEKELLTSAPRPFIYVTNRKLSIEPLYTGYSDNKVHELVFVYQITDKID